MPVESRSSMFETFDGLGLYEQWWNPEGPPRAGVIIIHGLGEHSGRYHKIALKLVRNGFSVYTFDLRGHGKSDGVLAAVDTFDDYLDDLEIWIEKVKEKQQQPLFFLGHSMGGLIAALYTAGRQPQLRGLILSAPVARLGESVSSVRRTLSRLVGRIFPGMPTVAIDPELLSREKQVVTDYENDPLVYHGKIPAVMGLELLRGQKSLREQMDLIQVPALVMHGGADLLASPDGSRELYEGIKSRDKTFKLYEDMEHDLLHDAEHRQVFGDILAWINERVRAE